MVSSRGIEANSEKIMAIINMNKPKIMHNLWSLNSKIVALSRFFSKSAKAYPFQYSKRPLNKGGHFF